MNQIRTILRGVGQVMLQNNALTGLVFLLGIFYNSWLLGVGAIFGNVVSTLAAVALKYDAQDINNGLYGFNGTLVGIAVWFFFAPSAATAIAIIVGAVLSTLIMHAMKKKMPAFTAPFVISTWIVMLGIKLLQLAPLLPPGSAAAGTFNISSAVSMGFGQVMFQGNIITGVLFFIAILINSRTAALFALYGSVLGGLLALLFSFPISMINIGLFGYNAVLCGIALEGKKLNNVIFASIAIALSVLINYFLGKTGVITLTAPFVLATWIVLFLRPMVWKKIN